MICPLLIAGVVTQSSIVLSSKFDLSSTVAASITSDEQRRASSYRLNGSEWQQEDDGGGIQIKLRWKRVRVRVPLPSI